LAWSAPDSNHPPCLASAPDRLVSSKATNRMAKHPKPEQSGHARTRQLAATLSQHKMLTGVGAVAVLSLLLYTASSPAASKGRHPGPQTSLSAHHRHSSRPGPGAALSPQTASNPLFPPRTLAGFRRFASSGNATQVHQISRVSLGLSSCPTPTFYVTVSPRLGVRAVEADLSAFFLDKGLLAGQCQAFVFAFHSRHDYEEHRNNGYTVGRVALTNGSGSQRTLEVDRGSSALGIPQAQFDFSFSPSNG
jgi:hypothetical protein